MTTPTPEDRQATEWAKNQLMEMGVEDPTTRTTPIVIDNATMNALLVNADRVRQLENELGEVKSALSIALRERESARQAISMADGTLLQIIAERDAWKAKAERTCVWSNREWSEFCKTECGESFPIPRQVKYKCCPSCGGRIIKEEK